MARFRYSLQSILDIKLKLETQAKQEFSAAKNALDAEEEKLAALKERKSFYEAEAVKLRSGVLSVKALEENKTALACMEQYIVAQRLSVDRARAALETKREQLTEVMKERKTHEALKEKAFEAFLQDENKRESKEVDELTSYTYGQKQQVNE